MTIPGVDPLHNKLLAKLSRDDFDLLAPHFVAEQLAQWTILTEANDEIDQIYFPLEGMISLVIVMKDGKAIETGAVGRDGVFGAAAGFGLYKSRVRSIVQVRVAAVRMPARRSGACGVRRTPASRAPGWSGRSPCR